MTEIKEPGGEECGEPSEKPPPSSLWRSGIMLLRSQFDGSRTITIPPSPSLGLLRYYGG